MTKEGRESKKRKIQVVHYNAPDSSAVDMIPSPEEVCDPGVDFEMLFSNWSPSDFPPSRVRNFKFKQELIAIMALDRERSVGSAENGVQASNCDVNIEDEARRLKKEMDVTIQEVQVSIFYHKFVEQLQNDGTIQSNIRRVLGKNSHMPMVIYGIGSIEYNYRSQHQLALALLLKRDFSHWIGGVEVFDPYLSPADCKTMEMLGCNVLTVNESCRRRVERPTLFFLPYLLQTNVGDLLDANWCPARLNQMVILSNSFESMLQGPSVTASKALSDGNILYASDMERLEYTRAIQKHAIEVKVDMPKIMYWCMIARFSWHFFNLDTGLDMELLLPGNPSKDIRLKLRRLYDKWNKKGRDHRHLNNVEEEFCMEPFYNTDPNENKWSQMNLENRSTRRMHCLWRPPHSGWVKLNFSGIGHFKDALAGFGGVFHDEHENRLAMYCGNIGEADSIQASAEALRQGLRCLQYLSPMQKLVIEGDDVQIIRWVNEAPEPYARIAEALSDIFELMVGIETVVRHVYEEANSVAVEAAKRGTKLPNLRLWISPMSEEQGTKRRKRVQN